LLLPSRWIPAFAEMSGLIAKSRRLAAPIEGIIVRWADGACFIFCIFNFDVSLTRRGRVGDTSRGRDLSRSLGRRPQLPRRSAICYSFPDPAFIGQLLQQEA
jgi:hypothetical protein